MIAQQTGFLSPEAVLATVVGLLILGVCALTLLYPWWGFKSKFSRFMLHLPLAVAALYFVYEAIRPPGRANHADAVFPPEPFAFAAILYAMKLILYSRAKRIQAADEKEMEP